jgi:hypothetical protein
MHAHHVPCTGSVASARSASSTGVMTCVSERRFRLYFEIQGANEQTAKRFRNTSRSPDKRRFINHERLKKPSVGGAMKRVGASVPCGCRWCQPGASYVTLRSRPSFWVPQFT